MPSVVNAAFHAAIAAALPADRADLLHAPIGGGPAYRETNRALMLGDRAVREWVASAIASLQQGAPNALEDLSQLGKPEDFYFELEGRANQLRDATNGPAHDLARAAATLARAVPGIDSDAPNEMNREAFEATSQAAAACLLRAGAVHGEDFVVSQANLTLGDLISVAGWTNQLGPRFEGSGRLP